MQCARFDSQRISLRVPLLINKRYALIPFNFSMLVPQPREFAILSVTAKKSVHTTNVAVPQNRQEILRLLRPSIGQPELLKRRRFLEPTKIAQSFQIINNHATELTTFSKRRHRFYMLQCLQEKVL